MKYKAYINLKERLNEKITKSLEDKSERISNTDKLLSLLKILGNTTFEPYKEKKYNHEIDYKELNLESFIKMDIKTPIILKHQHQKLIEELFKKLYYEKQTLKNINMLKNNKEQSEKTKAYQIEKEMIKLKSQQSEIEKLKKKLYTITNRQRRIRKINNILYIEPDNKDFIRHLIRALENGWIKYKEDNKNILERIVEINDYNDFGELIYISYAPYKKWIELFNNKIFEEPLKKYNENTYEHTLSLEKK